MRTPFYSSTAQSLLLPGSPGNLALNKLTIAAQHPVHHRTHKVLYPSSSLETLLTHSAWLLTVNEEVGSFPVQELELT